MRKHLHCYRLLFNPAKGAWLAYNGFRLHVLSDSLPDSMSTVHRIIQSEQASYWRP